MPDFLKSYMVSSISYFNDNLFLELYEFSKNGFILPLEIENLINKRFESLKNTGRFIQICFGYWKDLILAVVIWIFTNKVKKTKDLHPIILIAASAVIGVVFSMA